MRILLTYLGLVLGFLIGLGGLIAVPSGPSWAQGEVTSKIYRYRERVATGYYEGYEVSPRRARAILPGPGIRRGLFPFGSTSALVRIRSRLPDSHRGLKFYHRNTCIECHPQQARNVHSVRAGITCRQCHGAEPIAAINYHYSAMNPIRRHSYVCAKCHEGANFAFAEYYVHEPPAQSVKAKEDFPALYYAYWFMMFLLVSVLAFFLPHGFMVVLQELGMKRGKRGIDIVAFYIPKKYRDRFTERLSKKVEPIMEKAASVQTLGLIAGLKGFLKEKGKAVVGKLALLNPRKIMEGLKELFAKKRKPAK
jgi:hypothetical protein